MSRDRSEIEQDIAKAKAHLRDLEAVHNQLYKERTGKPYVPDPVDHSQRLDTTSAGESDHLDDGWSPVVIVGIIFLAVVTVIPAVLAGLTIAGVFDSKETIEKKAFEAVRLQQEVINKLEQELINASLRIDIPDRPTPEVPPHDNLVDTAATIKTPPPQNYATKSDDLKYIILKYTETFVISNAYKPPIENEDGSRTFHFETDDQALAFFKNLAEDQNPPCKFLCQLEGQEGEAIHWFSCGDGKFYQGSVQEITDQLTAAAEDVKNNPAALEIVREGLAQLSEMNHKTDPVAEKSKEPTMTAPHY